MESTALVKVFALLEALAGHPDGRPLAELAADAGVVKPTAHRVLQALAGLGYVERCGPGVYRQTAQVRRLAATPDDRRLIAAAEPPLRALHHDTGETVNLGVLRQDRVVYLVVLESPQPLRRVVVPGTADPFACTALGRAIVAHLPDRRRARLLRTTPLERRTPKTVIDPDALRQVLEAARDDGYAVEEDQTDVGVVCVAAPVFDRAGVAGAVSVSLPTARAPAGRRRKLVAAVTAAAAAASDRLKAAPET